MSLPHLQTTTRTKKSQASSGQAAPLNAAKGRDLARLKLNIEGLNTAKINFIKQTAIKNKLTMVLLQETHTNNKNLLKLPGNTLAGHTADKHHSIATFVLNDIAWSAVAQSTEDAEVEWITTKVQDTTIVTIYKPPPGRLYPISLPDAPASAVYAGAFNSHHTDWANSSSNADGDFLADWALIMDATLLYDPEPCTVYSAH